MDGFEPHKQSQRHPVIGNRLTITALAWLSLAVVLCQVSGCASTRNAWRNLTAEPPCRRCAHAGCGCGETDCAASVSQSCPGQHATSMRPTEVPPAPENGQWTQQQFPPHQGAAPQYANQSQTAGPRPQFPPGNQRPYSATASGTPNVWQPNPPWPPEPAQNQAGFQHQDPYGSTLEESAVVNHPRNDARPAAPASDAYREYRTQVQILSEQILQMKAAQESMQASQDSLQQAHEREILEIKLQHTTADRDRLQREHQLESELQKQRQRELEAIDSLSQMIEGTSMSAGAAGSGLVPTPNATVRAGKPQTVPATQLPPVQ